MLVLAGAFATAPGLVYSAGTSLKETAPFAMLFDSGAMGAANSFVETCTHTRSTAWMLGVAGALVAAAALLWLAANVVTSRPSERRAAPKAGLPRETGARREPPAENRNAARAAPTAKGRLPVARLALGVAGAAAVWCVRAAVRRSMRSRG